MPCVVQKYDAASCTVDVHINIKELFKDLEQEVPVLIKVPVVFSRTQNFAITYPINKGDSGFVLFCDRDIKGWVLGGHNVKPASKRMHHFNDCVFVAGLFPFNKGAKIANAKDLYIGYKSTTITVEDNGNITIKSSKDITLEAANDININAGAKANVNIKNDAAINIAGNADLTVSGKTTLTAKSDATISVTGNTSLTVSGDITSKAVKWGHTGDLELLGAMKISKTLDVSQATTLNDTLTISKEVTASASVVVQGAMTTHGGITNDGGNMVSNGITLETHKHLYDKALTTVCGAGAGSVEAFVPTQTNQPI